MIQGLVEGEVKLPHIKFKQMCCEYRLYIIKIKLLQQCSNNLQIYWHKNCFINNVYLQGLKKDALEEKIYE